MKEVLKHFKRADPVIHGVLRRMDAERLRATSEPKDYFVKLCREIIGQQLAGKAADAIIARFKKLFPRGRVSPARVLARSEQELRNVGMSWAKARTIRDLAQKVIGRKINFKKFPTDEDEAVVAELIKVRGIGRWTAEMFLIFTLGREDVFSHGDLGLQKGFSQLYPRRHSNQAKTAILARWSPYRSYACLALWHINDV